MSNIISHLYQLEESIINFMAVRYVFFCFLFYLFHIELKFAKTNNGKSDQTSLPVGSDLVLLCLNIVKARFTS